jgi:hypothetical protein
MQKVERGVSTSRGSMDRVMTSQPGSACSAEVS